jgi:glycyl-tRNA synthetase beta chain
MANNIDLSLLVEDAERTLNERLDAVGPTVQAQLARRDYTRALSALAALREPVDTFFNDVMVNAENEALRRNRLALLAALHAQMNCVADISKLAA